LAKTHRIPQNLKIYPCPRKNRDRSIQIPGSDRAVQTCRKRKQLEYSRSAGNTTILIKALEDSKWFIPIERENIANLLNERQIIRSTRQEYLKDADKNTQALPPLLYAGILLEGGVISYDSNIMTGGLVHDTSESELLHSTDRTGLPFIFVLFPH
jgi:curli biogenesis system outer membrane secretion channel CsgG